MAAKIIDGKKIADQIIEKVKKEAAGLSPAPCLAIVLVGNDPASIVYTKKKADACKLAGILSKNVTLPASATEDEIIEKVTGLNQDENVDAILVQLPLPKGIDEDNVLAKVSLEKDVDCFHPQNFGNAMFGKSKVTACTPRGVIRMLKQSGVGLSGKHAVVIGRSRIVGKPLAALLLNENCTVTVCHSKTANIAKHSSMADIVCIAVGKPNALSEDMVKKGAVVIDIGTNRIKGKLVGDADFEKVSKKASLITPVPGGVGPVTVAMLLENALECYKQRRK